MAEYYSIADAIGLEFEPHLDYSMLPCLIPHKMCEELKKQFSNSELFLLMPEGLTSMVCQGQVTMFKEDNHNSHLNHSSKNSHLKVHLQSSPTA